MSASELAVHLGGVTLLIRSGELDFDGELEGIGELVLVVVQGMRLSAISS